MSYFRLRMAIAHMVGDDNLSRRSILSAAGAVTTGSVITTAATAQEGDQIQYERPLTMQENGIETTFHDCSRVVINSDNPSAVNDVRISMSWVTPDNQVQFERVDFENPDLPLEYVVNCNREEIGVEHGAATISTVNVWPEGTDFATTFQMPFFEWDCGEVRGAEVDPQVFAEHC